MRIVLITSNFPQLSETFLVSKFLGMLEAGWDVHTVCAFSDSVQWSYYPLLSHARSSVHVAWPHRPRLLAVMLLPLAILRCLLFAPRTAIKYLTRGWNRFGLDIFRRMYLDAELIILQPNVVHFEFGALAPERMYIKDLLGCKVLVSFRGYDLNFSKLDVPQYYNPVWEHADHLHLLGQDLWQRAICRGCPPEVPHTLIPPAIDTKFFNVPAHENIVSERPLHILSVGRLEWKKGYEDALQAVKLVRESGIDCIYRVVGDGEYYEALMFARHQLGLEECVELLGPLPREDIRGQLLWADVFLHAAVSEGFCNAVLEAQAMQVPVVCTDADGLSENVSHGQTGFVVPRRDPSALAEKMILLAHSPSLRKTFGVAGRQRVVANFQVDHQLKQFETLYESLLIK